MYELLAFIMLEINMASPKVPNPAKQLHAPPASAKRFVRGLLFLIAAFFVLEAAFLGVSILVSRTRDPQWYVGQSLNEVEKSFGRGFDAKSFQGNWNRSFEAGYEGFGKRWLLVRVVDDKIVEATYFVD